MEKRRTRDQPSKKHNRQLKLKNWLDAAMINAIKAVREGRMGEKELLKCLLQRSKIDSLEELSTAANQTQLLTLALMKRVNW